MTIKLIAVDMDGTLLCKDNTIHPETKQKLIEIQKKGIVLVLASGRSYLKLMSYAQELEMEHYGGFLVEINGLAFYDMKAQKRVVKTRMEPAVVHEIFHYFSQWDVEVMANLDDGLYDYNPPKVLEEKAEYRKQHNLPEDFPWTGGAFEFLYDNRKGYPRIFYIDKPEEIQEPVNKVCVLHHAEIIEKVSIQAKRDLSDRFWVGKTTPKWLEIMLPNITKATGLKRLGDTLGIKLEEMMAFGDGENDIEMIKEVGCGIAMGNAMDSLKEVADDVTDTNENNGIAKAIQKYFID